MVGLTQISVYIEQRLVPGCVAMWLDEVEAQGLHSIQR